MQTENKHIVEEVEEVELKIDDEEIQELISQFRTVINKNIYNPNMYSIQLVPKIRFVVVEESQFLENREKALELTKKLIEIGHGNFGEMIQKYLYNIVPDFFMYQNGSKIELVASSVENEIVARADLDVEVLDEIGYNLRYVTGIIEENKKVK